MDDLLPPIEAAIDRDCAAMAELLAELVAIPTENPPGRSLAVCADVLQATLSRLGFACERLAFEAGDGTPRPVLIATDAPSAPTLYFHGHYDVVPAFAPEQFVPRVEGDTMFGRGTSDMKSGLVAMIYAARAVRTLALAGGSRIALVLVPDEETGGADGSARLAAAGRLGADGIGMLLPEPTSGVVWHANRGAISLEVTVKGRAAHVGLAHSGVNAFERALPIVGELLEIKRELGDRSVLLVGGRVEAGSNFNVVPAECRFTIDRRINPDENLYAERSRLIEVFARAHDAGIDFETRIIQEGRAALTPPDHPLAAALASSIAAVTGAAPKFETCPGLLETRFYAEKNVPALAYGPGVLAVSHGPQEFVKLGRMVECAKVYALTAATIFGSRIAAPAPPGRDTARST